MAFRKTRQARYERRRRNGFLPFEARPLSRVSEKVPYMPQLIATRASLLARARREGWSQIKYNISIKELYRKKGWRKLNRVGKIVNDPWQMLRDYEDRYKSKHPEYESPWVKKQKGWRDFTSKFDRGLEKYEKGRYR